MKQSQEQPQEELRVPTPKGRQVLGLVDQRVGGSRMIVRCLDGKSRNCRIPGRLKRKLWIREGDVVLNLHKVATRDEKGIRGELLSARKMTKKLTYKLSHLQNLKNILSQK